jgi:hypothetical protein
MATTHAMVGGMGAGREYGEFILLGDGADDWPVND